MKGSQGARLTLVSEDSLQAAWLRVYFQSQGVTGVLVLIPGILRGLLGEFFPLPKADTCKVSILFKTFTTSKSIAR